MKVNLICVGKIKEAYFTDGIAEYTKRLSRFCSFHIVECREVTTKTPPNAAQIERILKEESEAILRAMKGYKVAFDIDGKELSSPELSALIGKARDSAGELSLVIGGSYGLHGDVKDACDCKLSFGKVTYPHQLMRLIAAEQLYRGFSILAGSEYHK